MIITSSPLRISLGGGGTDLPSYYREHTGFVISAAINKYVYITLHESFREGIIVRYSSMESEPTLETIKHPIVREALRLVGIQNHPHLEITSMADIPAGTGLGSSGSFTTALLRALHCLKKNYLPARELAEQACRIELDILGEPIGKQDQYIAAVGGITCFTFSPDGSAGIEPLRLAPETLATLEDNLMLFFTGIKRTASQVAKSYANNVGENHQHLRLISETVDEGIRILTNGDLQDFGKLLHEAWQVKRRLGAHVSNPQVDEIYARALRAGALGGKLIGAGGGGFMLLFVPPALRTTVRQALSDLLYVPFNFESEGSQIVFYDPEEDYLTLEHYNAASVH